MPMLSSQPARYTPSMNFLWHDFLVTHSTSNSCRNATQMIVFIAREEMHAAAMCAPGYAELRCHYKYMQESASLEVSTFCWVYSYLRCCM